MNIIIEKIISFSKEGATRLVQEPLLRGRVLYFKNKPLPNSKPIACERPKECRDSLNILTIIASGSPKIADISLLQLAAMATVCVERSFSPHREGSADRSETADDFSGCETLHGRDSRHSFGLFATSVPTPRHR